MDTHTENLITSAVDTFGIGSLDVERCYILDDGRILNCDGLDHFAVQEFYVDGLQQEEEANIIRFLDDTGAIRAGFYEGSYLIHIGTVKPTDVQMGVLMHMFAEWEPSVMNGIQIFQFRAGKELKKQLPAVSRPIDVRRAIEIFYD